MEIVETAIPDVKLLTPRKFGDHRGFFVETYNKKVLESIGFTKEFVQDNHSLSVPAGTIRGLHFQLEPYAQDKLVRVVRGAILDVAVDLRRGSPTFGRHVSARLDAETGRQILVPAGFAHATRQATIAACCGTIRIWASSGRFPRMRRSCPTRTRYSRAFAICPTSSNWHTPSNTF
jgi:dTDP-4-dehydrorhamnose 3,5-epimerase